MFLLFLGIVGDWGGGVELSAINVGGLGFAPKTTIIY